MNCSSYNELAIAWLLYTVWSPGFCKKWYNMLYIVIFCERRDISSLPFFKISWRYLWSINTRGQTWKQCAHSVIMTMSSWHQLAIIHHVPKFMSCHKAIVVILGGLIVFMITYILCKSYYCEIWLLWGLSTVSGITYGTKQPNILKFTSKAVFEVRKLFLIDIKLI